MGSCLQHGGSSKGIHLAGDDTHRLPVGEADCTPDRCTGNSQLQSSGTTRSKTTLMRNTMSPIFVDSCIFSATQSDRRTDGCGLCGAAHTKHNTLLQLTRSFSPAQLREPVVIITCEFGFVSGPSTHTGHLGPGAKTNVLPKAKTRRLKQAQPDSGGYVMYTS
jgi:hypothetical protein